MYTGGMMYRRSWILTSFAAASLLGQNKSAEEEKKLSVLVDGRGTLMR